MLHGCIPVIIIDNVHIKFETLFNVDEFSIRIPEANASRILDVLQAIPENRVRSMQAHLGRVWHRYGLSAVPYRTDTRTVCASCRGVGSPEGRWSIYTGLSYLWEGRA